MQKERYLVKKVRIFVLFIWLFYAVSLVGQEVDALLERWVAYVVNSGDNTVTPLDLSQDPPQADAPIQVGASPRAIAITNDGKTAYVVNSGDNTVTPIDLTTRPAKPGDAIPVGIYPVSLSLLSDDTKAYVCNAGGASVTPLDLTKTPAKAETVLPVGPSPRAIVFAPTGKAYVVNSIPSGVVTLFDTETGSIESSLPVGNCPVSITLTPNGQKAYVGNYGDGTVTPITLLDNIVESSVYVGDAPCSLACTSDGTKVYIAHGDQTGKVTSLFVDTNRIDASIPIGKQLRCIALTPDGHRGYVVDEQDHTVIPFVLETGTLESAVEVGKNPVSLSINPIQVPCASFTVSPGYRGLPSSFNAEASSAPSGIIEKYVWDFGDGTAQTVSSPITTHIYSEEGGFQVKLYVVSNQGPASLWETKEISVWNAPDPIASFSVSNTVVGKETAFDASLSRGIVWPITSYEWDFGDGSLKTTADKTVTHTYTSEGSFLARLLVCDSQGHYSDPSTNTISILPKSIQSPSKYTGKVTKTQQRGKPFSITMTWKKPTAFNIQQYEIFLSRTLVVSISSNLPGKYVLYPDVRRSTKRSSIKKQIRSIGKKYRIRAVSASGVVSSFIPLKVKK